MRKGVPQCFNFLRGNHRLATQPHCRRNNDGEAHPVFGIHFLHGHRSGFCIEGIENRFDHKDVAPAFDQAADLVLVSGEHLVECDHPEARVIGIRGIGE